MLNHLQFLQHFVPHQPTYPVVKETTSSIGILRIDDYDYTPALGDVDHPDSYNYDVHYQVVPGLTFERCKRNQMDEKVKAEFLAAIDYLVHEKGVSGITGDCGFMMNFQCLARRHTHVPVFLSSIV